jgi:hypothetical protein
MAPEAYTPGWKGPDGLVHIAGTHIRSCVFAECGIVIATGAKDGRDWPEYEVSTDVPTCLMCIGSAVDYLPWTAHQEVGIGVINVNALSKLNLKL